VDDVVVKTRNSNTLIADLEETFASLREYHWKLNPNKCVFGVPSGKLLGFIISHRGIEANPEKISAITSMKALTCIKDVQKLTGCMAALNRFISKLGERGLLFFKLLKHQEKFVWTPEADQALAQLKDFLSKPLLGGYPKNSDDSPNTREKVLNTFNQKVRVLRDGDSPSRLHKSQKTESVYMCPRAPFYREMKGLLHS
jgi:hypothetical protein